MLSKTIFFKNFKKSKTSKKIKISLKNILSKKSELINSLSNQYKDSYNIKKIKKNFDVRIIGMGGSVLGAKAIYHLLQKKISKKFYFLDNLQNKFEFDYKKRYLNLIISKSGNTLETISNANIFIKKKDKNIFITENKNSYILSLAKKLKSEIIHHNNYIGGRYAVLSEVGMLPAELMGLNPAKFRQLNNLVKNKRFMNLLIANVNSIISMLKKGKSNSIILNYDPKLKNFLEWYKQLVGESLGKNGKGLLPVISEMPKDNHSVMQLYLDGVKNNFYTFFSIKGNSSLKINTILNSDKFLKDRTVSEIKLFQKKATENVFERKKIPFRSFEIIKLDEKTIGELFIFFILETILLGSVLKVNPYDQPAVESIKKETKKFLKF
tara:strand:- start:2545 stop:3687 length:1143 start_codon:yes stop_codon:yes gene_type:complete